MSLKARNYVDKESIPKGWAKVSVAATPTKLPDQADHIFVQPKLKIAQWKKPVPGDAKQRHPDATEKSKSKGAGLPDMFKIEPQPELARFWVQMLAVAPGTENGTILYKNTDTGAISASFPTGKIESPALGRRAAPPPPLPAKVKSGESPLMHRSTTATVESEDIYTEATLENIKSSTDAMSTHPVVLDAQGKVVLLVGTNNGREPADVTKAVSLLENAKIPLFPHRGEISPQFAGFMPAVIEVCAVIVVVCTDEIHSKTSQAITYLRHAQKIKKDIIIIKASDGVIIDKGQLGLLVAGHEIFDVSSKGSKSDIKQMLSSVTKLQKHFAKTLKKNKNQTLPRSRGSHSSASRATPVLEPSKKAVGDHRPDLQDSIVLLYSWGRQTDDGIYPNQMKVIQIKHVLRSKGYKVWVDVDHMHDEHLDMEDELVAAVSHSALVICCVTNSFHVPESPVHQAFLLAIETKVPGESIFGIKLSETCDMRCGAYGLHMEHVKWYDFSVFGPDTPEGLPKVIELHRDVERLPCFDKQGSSSIGGEELYGELEYVATDTDLPQVEAARGAVMLSYGWGKRVNGVHPNQLEVLQLQQRLRDAGFNVWMDVDNMMGNMDVVMAGAIEICAAVLVCVSEDYVRGVNAQKEWVYANQRKVPNKNFFVVKTTAQELSSECFNTMFGMSKSAKRSAATSRGMNAIASNWLKYGGPDAIIDLSDVCTPTAKGYSNPDQLVAFSALNKNLEDAGAMRRKVRQRFEPSLKTLEAKVSKRGKSLRRHKTKNERPMWFVGPQDRDQVKKLMAKSSPGDYIVRESKTNPGAYVVVCNDGGQVRERKIARDAGKFIIKIGSNTVSFTSMELLLNATPEVERVATHIIKKLKVQYYD